MGGVYQEGLDDRGRNQKQETVFCSSHIELLVLPSSSDLVSLRRNTPVRFI